MSVYKRERGRVCERESVCVCERESEREIEKERESERKIKIHLNTYIERRRKIGFCGRYSSETKLNIRG